MAREIILMLFLAALSACSEKGDARWISVASATQAADRKIAEASLNSSDSGVPVIPTQTVVTSPAWSYPQARFKCAATCSQHQAVWDGRWQRTFLGLALSCDCSISSAKALKKP